MTDIKDINHDDIREFLLTNNIEVTKNDQDYDDAFRLMKDPNSVKLIPIVEWMMAYNLMIKKVNIDDYEINNLINLSLEEQDKLAKKLGMRSNSIDNIINILYYLHKIYLLVGDLKIPKHKNIYNIFPKELWVKILLNLNCKDVDVLINKSLQFKNLINDENIKERVKMRGFPRLSGHCESFDVSQFVDDMNHELSSRNFLTEEIFNYILEKLYDSNYNLVRGDLICFEGLNSYRNDGVYIFNGNKIVELSYEIDDYGHLPEEFTVINNNVPIRYWQYNEDHKGISHNNLVWFDHKLVKQQCIDNIIDVNDELFTTFKYNNKIYKIYAYRSEFDEESRITKENFVSILLNADILSLEIIDEFGDDENTLYINQNYKAF